MPKVTVLLTVLNGMPYLPAAVNSILEQSFLDFAFLVINNGSTDGTRDYLDSLHDPRLDIRHLPATLSRSQVLNTALELVKTDLTAIIDADDTADNSRLERQYEFLQAHPEVVLLGSAVNYIDREGHYIGRETFALSHEDICNHLPLSNQFAHATCMFRTDAARIAGAYPENYPYAQDLGLWLALIRLGGKVANLPEHLACIRLHPAQATRNQQEKDIRAEDNYHLTEEMLQLPGLSAAAKQMAYFRMAGALYCLGKKQQAFACCKAAFTTAPFGLVANQLLWKRLGRELKKHLVPMKV